ncbi:hypothetical protein A33Q_3195 [Indibacter alkaliphilus LW1]|uniref:Uncharacterized protein n=1 Tax=Indibacter alkaliphilus (strain CCUG 57479 / KCTC 22604 / LW1) TaxID=1189612 RepID=S2E170_INDAL|nr:hypothetical protein A33Q_3195 [Indibacter alkaliphilus LW1]
MQITAYLDYHKALLSFLKHSDVFKSIFIKLNTLSISG